MSNQTKKQKKKAIPIIAVILLVAAAVVLTLILTGAFRQNPDNEPDDHKGVTGYITDDWDTGVEETSAAPKKGTQIPGYSSAEMKAGETSLHLSIGNPKENTVGMFATLRLADGTVLYESPLLKPGQGLTEIPLSKTLEKGTYDAMVVYQCVLLDEKNTPLNAAESGFTLYVN